MTAGYLADACALIVFLADPNAARLDINRLAPQLPLTWRLSADLSF